MKRQEGESNFEISDYRVLLGKVPKAVLRRTPGLGKSHVGSFPSPTMLLHRFSSSA